MSKKGNSRKNNFSSETIKRLSVYLRNSRKLKEQGVDIISSDKLTELLNVKPEQFRKDLSYFGEFGKRGVGYNLERLIKELENILGVNKQWNIVLVGIGKLGGALLGFEGFSKFNIRIKHAFDSDENKIGKIKKGVNIEDIKDMKKIIKKSGIKIAMISTPPDVAQEIANILVEAGIKCILNFAPSVLRVPQDILVSNVDMASELESLIFFAKQDKINKV